MRLPAPGLAGSILGLSLLTACAITNPILGDTASEKTRSYAEYVFTGFKTVWIPALGVYHTWTPCTTAGHSALCYDSATYKKLYVLTDAATRCMVATTEPNIDVMSLSDCLGTVMDAKLAFTQAGISVKEPAQ